MQFRPVIALLAVATAVSAAPCDSCDGGDSGGSGGSDSGSQCSSNQESKCCSGLTQGLNLNILPALCLPLLGNCNNQVACCESNGIVRTPELSHHSALDSSSIATASSNLRTVSDEEDIRDSVNGHVLLRFGGIGGSCSSI
ncbi:hypothetical protein ABOM_002138 [Aspergillus bombycis]|uniref:Hydrophobin n=1 Tax=Aspergillus bombycis TaxID=109264 RepID=A0A1F8A954_9EURO|nr:hypothetical protein ABOM_002138 [Aspergillus bombycis]OGM48272.1 hypothetical protein ABOM_002138 [Aspergillus bombycis]